MRTSQIFFYNLMTILNGRGLSLAWIEEKTGINEIFLSTFEYVSDGLSFQLVIKVAVALGVTIESLISEDGKIERVFYEQPDPRGACKDIYRWFWTAVDYEADRKNKDLYDIARAQERQ